MLIPVPACRNECNYMYGEHCKITSVRIALAI
jgi:hypothetical protein